MNDDLQSFGRFLGPSTIQFERILPHPPEQVWHAITVESELPKWFVPYSTHLDLQKGGRWHMDEPDPPEHATFWGYILDLREAERIELSWGEGPSSMWFEIEPKGAGTLLRFGHRLNADDVAGPETLTIGYGWGEQPRGPGTFQPGLAAAWHEDLDRLTCYLAAKPVPPIGTVDRRVIDHYRALIDLA